MNEQRKIYDDSKKRTPSQRTRIIEALRAAGDSGVYNNELTKISTRYDARLSELYAQGFEIKVELIGKSLCKYTLLNEPTRIKKPEKAVNIVLELLDKRNDKIAIGDLLDLLRRNNFTVVRKHSAVKKISS